MFGTTTKPAARTALNGAHGAGHGDVRGLVRDARTMLTAAAQLSGEKAEDMRHKGMEMLDDALGQAHALQDEAVARGRRLVRGSDQYVRSHPWRTVAAAAGLGLVLGMLLGRR